jgi:serine/threonine protein kinase
MNPSSDFGRSFNQLSAESALPRLLQARIDGELSDNQFVAAIRGKCTQSEFVAAISTLINAEPQSMPRVMGLVNRLKNRGDIPMDLARLLESRMSRKESARADDGATLDLGSQAAVGPSLVELPRALPLVEIGRVLRDRYVIEHCLGTGGKGTVFKALDRYRSCLPPSQQYVAIKVFHETLGNRDEMIEVLRGEIQSAQALSHPNIVKVYDVDRDGDLDFFTMELLEGELLSGLMRRFQPVPMPRPHAWEIIRQIASGLEHAHARQVVHADLKPQKIMVTKPGEVRILEFGSSRRFAKETHVEPPWRGAPGVTPAYACCELLDGATPDPRDDLYALACIAYELLTGTHPFQRRRASEARDFGVVPARPSGLSRRQWQTLAKGLSWHRAGRSISVSEWFKGLKPRSERAQPLAGMGDLKPALVAVRRSVPSRPFALFSVLLIIATVSLLFVPVAPGGKVTSAVPSARPAQNAEAAGTMAPKLLATQANSARPTPSHGAPLLPSEYQVQRGQHFAEIRVHRPASGNNSATLTWWTEPKSARPGVDYVSQGKVSQAFPKGQKSMSVFVKLLPEAKRSQSEVFYVAAADESGQHANQIAHTAVRLPSSGTRF